MDIRNVGCENINHETHRKQILRYRFFRRAKDRAQRHIDKSAASPPSSRHTCNWLFIRFTKLIDQNSMLACEVYRALLESRSTDKDTLGLAGQVVHFSSGDR